MFARPIKIRKGLWIGFQYLDFMNGIRSLQNLEEGRYWATASPIINDTISEPNFP